MAYLVQANALKLMQFFQQEWLIVANTATNSLAEIERDLQRTQFLGSQADAEQFIKCWCKQPNPESYTAGNISAASLSLLFDSSPLQKEHEPEEEFRQHYRHQEFAYINEQQQSCGLMIMTRQDEPAQWMIGLVTNTNLPPQERTVTLLASFALHAFITDEIGKNQVAVIKDVAAANNLLFQHINSPFIVNFIAAALTEKPGELSTHWLRISHLLRTVAFSYDQKDKLKVELSAEPVDLAACAPHALLADNPFLDMAQELNLSLSAPVLLALCDKESALYKELLVLINTDDSRINNSLFVMACCFYDQGVLSLAHDFLHTHVFSKVLAGSFWDETQIQLIPHLIHEGYSLELFQVILSQPAYYDSVLILTQLGLEQLKDQRSMMQAIPLLFNEPDKLDELEFIYSLPDRQCRALCLIFWAKNESTEERYREIISATQQYPYLAATLCDRSRQGKNIKELFKEVSTPEKHLQHSLKSHFAQQFKRYKLDSSKVKDLNPDQLIKAHKAFEVLHHVHMTNLEKDAKRYHQLVLENNTNGLLWRFFLPDLAHVVLEADRNILIHYLHVGVTKNIKSLDDIIVDASLTTQARELCERLICVNQVFGLFSDEAMTFTASREEPKARQLRQVILKIDKACNNVDERLSQSTDKYSDWGNINTRYRHSLYQIAYDSLCRPGINYAAKLEKAQQEVLELVDPATTLWWEKVLIAIANAVILLFSGSLANKIKEQQTGNYWFFNQTRSGEFIRHLQKDIIDIIETPEQYPAV